MKATGIREFGAPVELLKLPGPRALRPDEVLIDVRASGMGNWDEIARKGGWDLGVSPPMALGVEAAGLAAAVGDHVARGAGGRPGDRAFTSAARAGSLGRAVHRGRRARGRHAARSAVRCRGGPARPGPDRRPGDRRRARDPSRGGHPGPWRRRGHRRHAGAAGRAPRRLGDGHRPARTARIAWPRWGPPPSWTITSQTGPSRYARSPRAVSTRLAMPCHPGPSGLCGRSGIVAGWPPSPRIRPRPSGTFASGRCSSPLTAGG